MADPVGANRNDQRVLVLTLKFLAPQKTGFSRVKTSWFFFQCGPYNIFKKKLNQFFAHENFEKWAVKVAHNQSKLFFYSPAHSPQPRIDFPYYKYVPSVSLSVILFYRLRTRSDRFVEPKWGQGREDLLRQPAVRGHFHAKRWNTIYFRCTLWHFSSFKPKCDDWLLVICPYILFVFLIM